ncbi:MAG TPA: TonB-dependent receptor plug domain-containing protein, partial [Flavobacterium sp.]|nr:TonB-dependent receptor plug domain-containing protein [Flavobacterium sp.]
MHSQEQKQEQKTVPAIEKIYLHTDRDQYFLGDDLWYKAYDVRAYNNLLFDNSNVLYVELISPEAKIIARNKTNIEMGLGYGDFQLTDSLGVKPGVYQLRAYTNWNRNYGEDFVFKKNIEIIDVFNPHSKTNKTEHFTVELKMPSGGVSAPNKITVDFFPEGGSLLDNVASVVGFKAVDANGNPVDIKGEIYDSGSEIVTPFYSTHDGMGKFPILPIEGKQYYAKIKTQAGNVFRVDLPSVAKQGYLLNCRQLKGRNIISISTNEATLSQNPNVALKVVCKARGINYFETIQQLTQTTLSFELAKDITPDGISQITLYDNDSRPQSERLLYVEKEHDLEVKLTTDKVTYQPNEQAIINVSSKSKAGTVKSASYSLSVTDMNGVLEEKEYGTNISSYFLMESDIRGKVHNPGYYFDINNLKRLEHLDNLLLTQGWRDFLWKTMPKANDTITYKVEKGFTVSGRVKQLFGDKAKANFNMTLGLMNKKRRNIFNALTDATGSFKFEDIMFSGKTNMFLSSVNDKGKFRGEIVLDVLEQTPLLTDFKNEEIKWTANKSIVVDNVFKKYAAFGVKPENILDEVTIVAKKKKQISTPYGLPDFTYEADEDAATFTDIYQLIAQKVPGTALTADNTVQFLRFSEAPLYIINGFEAVDNAQVNMIMPSDVERIDAVKGMQAEAIYGSQGANGIIAIYTKPNTGNKTKETFNSLQKVMEGFYMARAFYSPTPEQAKLEIDNKFAVRNTLYWNPYVHPDKTGNVSVNYLNTKVETKVKVALEG